VAVLAVLVPATLSSRASGGETSLSGAHAATSKPLAATSAAQHALSRLVTAFEPNVGQAAANIDFVSHLSGYTALISRKALTLSVSGASPGTGASGVSQSAKIVMAFANGHSQAGKASHRLPTRVNYELGSNPANWITGVSTYARVTYANVWPGVNVQYGGTRSAVEFEFIVSKFAHTNPIRVALSGQTALALQHGKLVISTTAGKLIESAPIAWQIVGGRHVPVKVAYRLLAKSVSLSVGTYRSSLPLYIDPSIGFGTYLGGSGTDSIGGATLFGQSGHPVAVNAQGDVYVTGVTTSTDFPGAGGGSGAPPATSRCASQTQFNAYGGTMSAFVSEFNSAGSQLLYSTYLGGSDSDFGSSIRIDAAGNAYVMGTTCSTDFPTTSGAFQSGLGGEYATFVAKLDPNGALVYSTLIGNGPGTDASSHNLGMDMAIDSAGNVYVTGALFDLCGAPYGDTPCPFPVTSGSYDSDSNGAGFGIGTGFLVKLDSTGSTVLAGTYLPSCSTSQIAVDGAGNVFLNQSCLPITPGAFTGPDCPNNGTTAELDSTLSTEVFGACFGGNQVVHDGGIAVDASGRVYLTGETFASDLPTTAGAFQTTYTGGPGTTPQNGANFVFELSADGTTLLYATYVGPAGAAGDYPALAVDGSGAVYVTGTTYTTNLPTTPWAIVASRPGGCYGPYMFKLSPDLSTLMYSTYFGGAGCTGGATGIGLDALGNAYVVGGAGTPDFQVTPGAFQTGLTGAGVGFVLQFLQLGNSGAVSAGGTLATSPTSGTNPYSVAVTSPVAGTVSVETGPLTAGRPGFSVQNYQVEVGAPATNATSPLSILFTIDPSALGGQTAASMQLFLDGVVVPDCGGGVGVASPDPCISSRSTNGDGSVALNVLTTVVT
jgi:hypothetical protein